MKKDKDTFEELLNETFLELDFDAPENEILLDATADSVLGSASTFGVSFGERVLEVLVSKWGVIGMILIGAGCFWVYQFNTEVVNYIPHKTDLIKKEKKVEEPIVFYEKNNLNSTPKTMNSAISVEKTIFINDKKQQFVATTPAIPSDNVRQKKYSAIPLVTFEEIKENRKAKEKLFKSISRLSKNKVALIKQNKNKVEERQGNLPDFAIWKTEITNAEYRIFLLDLLIQEKIKAYYKSRVVDEAWVTSYNRSFNETLSKHYSSHKSYNNYPVVNITRMGAELFCEWLTNGVNDYLGEKGNVQVRIPTEQEWVYAASNGGEYNVFPWGTDRVQDKHQNYLANFKPEEGSFTADGGLHTVKANSYEPNEFGLYNMSGNVAEMVTYDERTIGTKGGSWFSDKEEIKINGKDPNTNKRGAHPTIGFRPVILLNKRTTVLGKDEANSNTKKSSSNYQPTLSEKQRKFKNEEKNKLTTSFLKYERGWISAPFEDWNSDKGNVKYAMQTTEVTNKEYRAFLFDLIDQKRYEDFELAKPDVTKWRDWLTESKAYEEHYFTHEAYKDYPVVNVSTQGAELYCEWLFNQIKKIDEKGKYNFVKTIRLPSAKEWTYIASNGNKEQIYPWEGVSMRNSSRKYKGLFLANYKGNNKGYKGGQLHDNAEITSTVRSYWPTANGMYNLAGNVAEIVKYPDGEYGTKGGHWNSTAEELKVFALDKTKGAVAPSPIIGFRVLIEYNRVEAREEEERVVNKNKGE